MLVWPQKNALILKSRAPEKILNVIPKAKHFTIKGHSVVAVPHRTEETTLLRNLGYDAPALIIAGPVVLHHSTHSAKLLLFSR